MAQTGDRRIASATFFATQVDFSDAGDLKVFVDDEQLKAVEEQMADKGYLEGSAMAGAFNMLRPNDLIWSYLRQQLSEGQGAAALRPPGLERRRDAHAGGQPFLLPAQLLPARTI